MSFHTSTQAEDRGLMEEAKKNTDAYEKLYRKYLKKVYAYFWYRVGRDNEAAEDLTQETFLRAFKHRQRFEYQGYSYFAYLSRIAHNLLVNYYRKVKEIPLSVFGDNSEKLIQTTEDIDRGCDCMMLWSAMQDLATHEQNVLILYYWDGMATREIAGMTGKSENAIRLILSRSRKTLAKHPAISDLSTILTPEEIRKHTHRTTGKLWKMKRHYLELMQQC